MADVGSKAIRKIVHVDMDAFYASVEQRDRPELRDQPLVVAWKSKRSVVCAASYEARQFGIHSAMPAMRAHKLCPNAVFVPPDFTKYKAVSRQIHGIFARHTALIEPLSLDEAYLDVTHSRGPSATAIAGAIRAAIRAETQLTASAGIAPNKFLAKVASDWNKPNGQFVVPPQHVYDFLTQLPVNKIPGVGKVTFKKLAAMNIQTAGDLRHIPAHKLVDHFGRWGLRLHRLAHGIDDSPVRPHRPSLQISTEDTLAKDLPLAQLEPEIRAMAEKTWQRLKSKSDQLGETVTLKLKTAEFNNLTRSVTPTLPPTSAQELADIAWSLHRRVELPANTLFRLVGVGLSSFIDAKQLPKQQSLF